MTRILIAGVLLWSATNPSLAADTPEQLFANNCSICHQMGGQGVGGQFPRLTGRAGIMASSGEGRDFLMTLLLTGMSGAVVVDGQKIVGVMPDFSSFSDTELAAILTYVARLGGASPTRFTAAQVRTVRARPPVAPSELAIRRNALQSAKIIP